jgi:hypothetical protein
MQFIFVGIIIIFILQYNQRVDANKFIKDIEPYFHFLMESDYRFLVGVRYKATVDEANQLFSARVRNAMVAVIVMIFIFLSKLNFINLIFAIIVGYLVFKMPYMNLKKFYKRNLHDINMMLPHYLKTLEILIQHYTIPVALGRSIEQAPSLFKSGLEELVGKINSGDSTVDPYMDFAKQYPVRDSMRMMRLLYRLGLGSQQDKNEQLIMFSRSVSALQSKSRDIKYQQRLEGMENQTMLMLMVTGGGILILLLLVMSMNLSI